MKAIRVVLVGFGVIGKSLAKTILDKHAHIKREHDLDFAVVGVCELEGSLLNPGGVDLKKALEKDFRSHPDYARKKTLDVLDSIQADVVVEATPGNIKSGEPGLAHIRRALEAGMHVVTSNKMPLVLDYKNLMELARKNDVELRFEATVGGGIPLINTIKNNLQANKINSVYGILNGTTNFILSKMADESVSFDVALKEAQEMGIAEADPSYDVDGIDSAAKVVILANSIMGKNVTISDVEVTGIRGVTQDAVELAGKHDYSIKLIGDVGKLEVSPRLVPKNHPINVPGVLNAIMVSADVAGDITFVGAGAGGRETSSSMLSDILEVAAKV